MSIWERFAYALSRLCWAAGLAGALLLLANGSWEVVLIGAGIAFSGSVVADFFSVPGELMVKAGERLRERGRALSATMVEWLSLIWAFTWMGAWAVAAFYWVEHNPSAPWYAFLLWSLFLATFTFDMLARSRGDEWSVLSPFHQLSSMSVAASYIAGPFEWWRMSLWYAAPAIVFALIIVFTASRSDIVNQN